jgi:ABC-2 type transport system permease protein
VTGTIASELSKLRTARSNWILTLAAIVLSTLIALPTILFNTFNDIPGQVLISIAQFSVLFTMILGAMLIAGEMRHGSIAPALLVTPSRTRLIVAKLVAIAILGAVVGAVTFGLCLALGALLLPGQGYDLGMSGSEIVKAIAGGAAMGALYGVMGLGVGTLVRNQTGAIIVLLILLLFVDPIVASLWTHYSDYSLGSVLSSATGAFSQSPAHTPLGQAKALLLQLAYSGGIFLLGLLAFNRVDITD